MCFWVHQKNKKKQKTKKGSATGGRGRRAKSFNFELYNQWLVLNVLKFTFFLSFKTLISTIGRIYYLNKKKPLKVNVLALRGFCVILVATKFSKFRASQDRAPKQEQPIKLAEQKQIEKSDLQKKINEMRANEAEILKEIERKK